MYCGGRGKAKEKKRTKKKKQENSLNKIRGLSSFLWGPARSEEKETRDVDGPASYRG